MIELTDAFWFGAALGGVYGLIQGVLLGVIFATRNAPSYRGTMAGITDAVFLALPPREEE